MVTGQLRPPTSMAKPSIAVMPFENLSGDPEQDYWADGMVEPDHRAVSISLVPCDRRAIPVSPCGQQSTSPMWARNSELATCCKDRASGRHRIRVASQLIDTANNTHIWAGRFDQVVEDMFDLQDEIVGSIVGAVVPQFVASFQPTMPTGSRTTLSSWEWAMRGWNLAWRLEESGDSILRASAQIAQVPISGRREWKS